MNSPEPVANGDDNQGPNIQESARRQQMMRFGLLIFLLFLILDNKQPTGSRVPGDGHSSDNAPSHAEIPLNMAYAQKMKSVLASGPHQILSQKSMNATGLFRGSWTQTHVQSNSSHSLTGGGTALVQLVSVPVREVPDVSFVYGLLHLYKDVHREAGGAVHVSLEAGFPLQGILVSSQQKLVLFSTPYKSQRLYVRMGSGNHYNDTVSVSSASGNNKEQRRRLQEHYAAEAPALLQLPLEERRGDVEETEIGGVLGEPTGPEDGMRRHSSIAASLGRPADAHWLTDGLFSAGSHYRARDSGAAGGESGRSARLQLSSAELLRGAARGFLRRLLDIRAPSLHAQGAATVASSPPKGGDAQRQRKLSQSSAAAQQAQQQTARDAITANVLRALGVESVVPALTREVKLTPATPQGFLSVVLTDQPLQPQRQQGNSSRSGSSGGSFESESGSRTNTSSTGGSGESGGSVPGRAPEADFLVSIAIGESLLPARFKALQSSAVPPSMVITLAANRSAGASGGGGEGGDSGPASTAAGPLPHKGPSLPAECQYTIQLIPASQSSADPSAVDAVSVTPPASITPQGGADPADPAAETDSPGEPGQGQSQSQSKGDEGTEKQKQKAERLEPVLQLSGVVSSPNCKKEFSVQASAFNLELDVLKRKVDTYALAATFASLVQVFLVVFQMKQAATQALVSRISIAAVFAQSLLDANLCMVHLLLCFAFPSLFFGSFIWIAVIKLLLFSVFQMRLIINIYQARYSQELSSEGWQGLRTRLISLHARFYGAVLLILLVSITFYSRPVVAILALYSFWVPQILHSAYTGTKHSLHPAYLFGTSMARCFIPLYLLGCPNNFLTLLTIYINPQYLAVLSDAAVASASTGAADLQGLSVASASACWVLVLWQAAQLGLLLLQSSLGPRFFVPKQWLPQRYDYRRSIPPSVRAALANHTSDASAPTELSSSRDTSGDIAMTGIRSRGASSNRVNAGASAGIASGSGIGGGLHALFFGSRGGSGVGGVGGGVRRSGSDDEEEQDLETGSLLGSAPRRDREDASLSPVRASAVAPNDSVAAGTGNSRHESECVICYNPIRLSSGDYMITPCDHVFHEECLVRWTGVKLECPVCRAALPAMEEDQ